MIDHVLAIAGHEGFHRAWHAWNAASQRGNARELLRETWIVLERARLDQLLSNKETLPLTAPTLAAVLEGVRKHRPEYRALQDAQPEAFDRAQELLAEFDYKLRARGDEPLRDVEFHALTLRIRGLFEALGVELPFRVRRANVSEVSLGNQAAAGGRELVRQRGG